MRKAYEDNAGGLYVVDEEQEVVAWGAEQDPSSTLHDCMESDLKDWTFWADGDGNSVGDRGDNGAELTYADYISGLSRAGVKLIAEQTPDGLITYPDSMGSAGRKWSMNNVSRAATIKAAGQGIENVYLGTSHVATISRDEHGRWILYAVTFADGVERPADDRRIVFTHERSWEDAGAMACYRLGIKR